MTQRLTDVLEQIGRQAVAASRELAQATTAQKNEALLAITRRIQQQTSAILAANEADVRAGAESGLSSAMLDRARLDPGRIRSIADSVRDVVQLPDPIGAVLSEWTRPNGLKISKKRVPIGVIGIIYESRPNVTTDAASLCLKTGNAVILRGGSEAIRSNTVLAEAVSHGCREAGLPETSVQIVPSTDRAAVTLMAQMDSYIHMIITRGGRALIEELQLPPGFR
jgi:glutamate-5-semialdehyde dehydrogenase